ncbi:MAG: ABC-2 type transport system ATP-binding protein [Verrucomicrobiales bacterium]|jgi:ABC-2 type transport system ATP-binding protein
MIDFQCVSKRFSRKRPPALNEVSFEVKEGEIFGLLGHNGAGKSTALGVLLGLVHPDQGEAFINGISVQKQRVKAMRNVGAIFESPRFYEYLTGHQNLKILTGYSGFKNQQLLAETAEWCGIADALDRKVATYSHGMRQRLALTQALLPRPKLLMLDEPTNGLDPEGIAEFREQIRKLRDDLGITVLLNSHLLSEVEQLCDRVAILKGGYKVYDGKSTDFAGEATYHIDVDIWEATRRILRGFEATILSRGVFRLPEDRDVADLVEMLVKSKIRISELRREKRSLEELYLEVSRP